MADLNDLGITVGAGKYHEEIIYSVALLYNHLSTAIENYLAHYDLNSSKFNILLVVKHQGKEEGISQVEISKRLVVTRSNMTKMLDKLEQEKLVTRMALVGDRRVNSIKITKKGADLLDAVWVGYEKLLISLTDSLTLTQKRRLASHLVSWVKEV